MALAPDRSARRTRHSGSAIHPTPAPLEAARATVLRRLVAEASANLELDDVLRDVIDAAQDLFGADAAGLWLLQPGEHPLRLAAVRNLHDELALAVAAVRRDQPFAGLLALGERRPVVLDDPETAAHLGSIHARHGFRTVAAVPLVLRDEAVGLLLLYHRIPYTWSPDELELGAMFGAQMAIAVANARLHGSVREGAARLRAIQELSLRLNRIQDTEGIGAAIVAEADQLIAHDTIRVYCVDQVTQVCEPIAFQGEFLGIGTPSADLLRVRVGEGLTGWVALHNETLRLEDANTDPRGVQVGEARIAESMLLVPMSYEARVLGIIVVSKTGRAQYGDDDQRTLEIFAGYAAQALANAEAFGRVTRQQEQLHHRLESQRRLLDVSERLLGTLDPVGILELIADSLRAVVSYDSLTIYRVDRAARVRRAVVARDRFAQEILSHEGPLDAGITGWVTRNGEALLANDVHLDPRAETIPGTPEEPESMIVCPLLIAGEVVGTLNLARMGGIEAHFTQDEFELVQLFAAQASIALRNAETHGEVVTRAERDALTGVRNHGAFQRDLGELLARGDPFALLMLDLDAFKAYNDMHGHPAGDTLLGRTATALIDAVRSHDHVYRYGGDEFAVLLPDAGMTGAREVANRIRATVARLSTTSGAGGAGSPVSISVGVACYPEHAADKAGLVGVADRALYLAKPPDRSRLPSLDPTRDLYLAAVDQTTLRLLGRLEPRELLAEIVERAASLVGVQHGFLYLLEAPDNGTGDDLDLVARVGTGMFSEYDGYRLPRGTGVCWSVVNTGGPVVVDDYAEYPRRAPDLPADRFGAVCAVPLSSGDEVLGCIGLASGDASRPFSEREVEAVARFGQLASVALDNARLLERAQTEVRHRAHIALHDQVTGLPNRTLLLNRLSEDLDAAGREDEPRRTAVSSRIGLILLDLDRFKLINESRGHAAGDLVLAETGRRLVAAARTTDTVARLGSDEFGILLGTVRSVREAERVAERVQSALAVPFDLGGEDVTIGASVGIAVGVAEDAHPADLVREAEIALHRAKTDPVRSVVVFDPEMRTQTLDRAGLEHDLRGAIERSELCLHYQPLVDLQTGHITGMEALLRWQHPVRGMVAPLSFIPLAEETGLILPIGRWVLKTAIQQLREWQRRFPAAAHLQVSVNLSAREFAESDLIGIVAATLDHAGLRPEDLELEITESVVMDQTEASIERLRGLRALGVRLVLDDFGTGYSSLAYLRKLPLDTIKVDRSFVMGLGTDPADIPIVQAVISLAHGLGITVVAEGIETGSQLASLRLLACDRGQGYLLSRPLPAAGMEALLAGAGAGGVVLGET